MGDRSPYPDGRHRADDRTHRGDDRNHRNDDRAHRGDDRGHAWGYRSDDRAHRGDDRGHRADDRGYRADAWNYRGVDRGNRGDDRGRRGDERCHPSDLSVHRGDSRDHHRGDDRRHRRRGGVAGVDEVDEEGWDRHRGRRDGRRAPEGLLKHDEEDRLADEDGYQLGDEHHKDRRRRTGRRDEPPMVSASKEEDVKATDDEMPDEPLAALRGETPSGRRESADDVPSNNKGRKRKSSLNRTSGNKVEKKKKGRRSRSKKRASDASKMNPQQVLLGQWMMHQQRLQQQQQQWWASMMLGQTVSNTRAAEKKKKAHKEHKDKEHKKKKKKKKNGTDEDEKEENVADGTPEGAKSQVPAEVPSAAPEPVAAVPSSATSIPTPVHPTTSLEVSQGASEESPLDSAEDLTELDLLAAGLATVNNAAAPASPAPSSFANQLGHAVQPSAPKPTSADMAGSPSAGYWQRHSFANANGQVDSFTVAEQAKPSFASRSRPDRRIRGWEDPEQEPEAPGPKTIAVRTSAGSVALLGAQWQAPGEQVPAKAGEDGEWEESRKKVGLKLVGEMSPPSLKWEYIVFDESRRTFVGYLPNPLGRDVCKSFFEKVRSGTTWFQPTGPVGPIPRNTAWMVGGKNCVCPYRYGRIEVKPQLYPAWMVSLLQWVMPCCGVNESKDWPTSCNLNLYTGGAMSVGWHADDEMLFQGRFRDCRIISLSLGVKRSFELRQNWPDPGAQSTFRVQLGDGDLCTMEGLCQKHFQHRVPREDFVAGPRINLTWRWIVRHTPSCPASRSPLPP
eukprot:TRINITY_DN54576_c0_g1_i1.p1 TRINITY_DN54576_c0_g1~~TRINITY_DN54576_c0_g1_i1.p1  ORF type:complete len:787 (+),score=133.67 TRINITY_DN54576_c0_g1_i1:158-2518(+)